MSSTPHPSPARSSHGRPADAAARRRVRGRWSILAARRYPHADVDEAPERAIGLGAAGWDFYRNAWWHGRLLDARSCPVLGNSDPDIPLIQAGCREHLELAGLSTIWVDRFGCDCGPSAGRVGAGHAAFPVRVSRRARSAPGRRCLAAQRGPRFRATFSPVARGPMPVRSKHPPGKPEGHSDGKRGRVRQGHRRVLRSLCAAGREPRLYPQHARQHGDPRAAPGFRARGGLYQARRDLARGDVDRQCRDHRHPDQRDSPRRGDDQHRTQPQPRNPEAPPGHRRGHPYPRQRHDRLLWLGRVP